MLPHQTRTPPFGTPARPESRFTWEAIRRPLATVAEPADACWIEAGPGRLVAALAHPIGHEAGGPQLAARAIDIVRTASDASLRAAAAAVHAALVGTRGVSLALIRIEGGSLEFLSIGTIRGAVDDGAATVLPTQPGIVGVGAAIAPAPVITAWSRGSVLLLTRDGVIESWAALPHGASRLTTGAILRRLSGARGRPPDDGTAIVFREHA
ncbi:MAG: hypothetical protein ABI647_06475 [Gemmatimonadota bacterium]